MRPRARHATLAMIFVAASLAGCAAATRDPLLRLFFDGVPTPVPALSQATVGAGAPAATAPATAPPAVASLHRPWADGECARCHDKARGNVPTDSLELCLSCHEAVLAKMKTVHFPLEEGECTDCHQPHWSSKPKLLRETPSELCWSCHDKDDYVGGAAFPHEPAAEGVCTDCHSPHASRYPSLLSERLPDLCVTCHGEDPHEDETPLESLETCVGCHNPHGSAKEHLL